jgi:hypothetical protein
MQRLPRLDIPDRLQQDIVRGIERSEIFLYDDECRRFVGRFDQLLAKKKQSGRTLKVGIGTSPDLRSSTIVWHRLHGIVCDVAGLLNVAVEKIETESRGGETRPSYKPQRV